jgi:hypothetical protein
MLIIFSYFGPTGAMGFADYHIYRWSYPTWLWLLYELGGAGWVLWFFPSWTLLVLSLPVRKWPLTRFPRLVPGLLYGFPFIFTIMNYLIITKTGQLDTGLIGALSFVPIVLVFLVALFGGLIHNFITLQEPVARAQLRWLALGLGMGWGVPIAVLTYAAITQTLTPETDFIPLWMTILLPTSLAIAITRYRLFDIDIIIRKTVQYGVLTAVLGLVYYGSVLLLQGLFTRVTGEKSAVALVLSTLLIAALFTPLRRRIQEFIDRRFFRKKYDAAQVLAQFAQTAQNETDMEALQAELLRVVQETMQPETVSIWVKK